MFGILLITLGTLLSESSESFGKLEVQKKEEGIFTMGLINSFMVLILLSISLLFGHEFIIKYASLPTLIPRIFLEVIQTHVTILAITRASRSTYAFLRTITIPLLLIVDLFLGYKLEQLQYLGVFIITAVIFIASYKNVLNKEGIWFVVFTAINAVITISLYKYDISHFNSAAGEQITVLLVVFAYLLFMFFKKKEGTLKSLFKAKYFIQSSATGIGGLMETFAYIYAPASIILSAKRATGMVWSTLAGWKFFGEDNLLKKLVVCAFLVLGISLLAF